MNIPLCMCVCLCVWLTQVCWIFLCVCVLTWILWKKTKYWKCPVDYEMYVGLSISCKVSIYRNITCPRRNVSSPMLVVCLFRGNFWGCVQGWSKSNRKGRTRKKKVAECIHFRGVECWKSKCKRECVDSGSHNVRVWWLCKSKWREFLEDESIYRQSLSYSWLQMRGTNHVTSWEIGFRDWLVHRHLPSLFQEQVASWPF